MRTSTPRAPRQKPQMVVKTVNIFDQPLPRVYGDLNYGMSIPNPIRNPCEYAQQVSGFNQAPPAQRILQKLAPTSNETESMNIASNICHNKSRRSANGDPALKLALLHNLAAMKASMLVSGKPVEEYKSLKDSQLNEVADKAASTPLRRLHSGPQGSVAKRQRTRPPFSANTSIDGDISMDMVHSVLRLVDETLIDSPERMHVVTPRVQRAAPVPSPRDQGPAFAYSQSQLERLGGAYRKSSPASFSLTRI